MILHMKSYSQEVYCSFMAFGVDRVRDGDPVIYLDVTLPQVEGAEFVFSRRPSPEGSARHMVTFDGWLLDHCMNRQVRPIEALKEFQGSKSIVIRQIATKALAQRYAIFESDKTNAEVARYTMWTMRASWAAALIATIALIVSCSSGSQSKTSKVKDELLHRVSMSYNSWNDALAGGH